MSGIWKPQYVTAIKIFSQRLGKSFEFKTLSIWKPSPLPNNYSNTAGLFNWIIPVNYLSVVLWFKIFSYI